MQRPLKSETLNGASCPVKGGDGPFFLPDASRPVCLMYCLWNCPGILFVLCISCHGSHSGDLLAYPVLELICSQFEGDMLGIGLQMYMYEL